MLSRFTLTLILSPGCKGSRFFVHLSNYFFARLCLSSCSFFDTIYGFLTPGLRFGFPVGILIAVCLEGNVCVGDPVFSSLGVFLRFNKGMYGLLPDSLHFNNFFLAVSTPFSTM